MAKKDTPTQTPEEIAAAEEAKIRKDAEDAQVAATIKAHTTSTARPDMSEFLTDEERKVREETARQLAAGVDIFGDDEPIVARQDEADEINAAEAAAAEEAKQAAAAGEGQGEGEQHANEEGEAEGEGQVQTEGEGELEEAAAGAQSELTPEQIAAAAEQAIADAATAAAAAQAEAANVPDLNVPVTLTRVADPKTLAAKREELEAKVDTIEQQYVDNKLTDAERAEQLKVARRELNTALTAEATNNAKLDMNQQARHDSQQATYAKLRKIAKPEGVDYETEKAGRSFDQALSLVVSDPDNATLSFGEQAYKAHQMVKAMLGIQGKPTTTTTTTAGKPAPGKPAPRVPPKGPLTLRGVPSASTSDTGGNAADAGARLRGTDYEAWFARQPASVRKSLLDS